MAGAHGSNHRIVVANKVETAFGTATAVADLTRLHDFGEADVSETIQADLERSCGNELYTGQTITAQDASFPFNTSLRPEAGGWILHKLTGGGTAYTVSGIGPYTHTFKKLAVGVYQQKSFTVARFDQGRATYHSFKGGVIGSATITGSLEQKRLMISGTMEFDGQRSTITAPTTTCVDETAFRFTSATINIAPHAGANLTGLKSRGFSIAYSNNPESNEEVERTGLYASAREHGDRECIVEYSVLLDQGETLDGYLAANQAVSWSVSVPHANGTHSFAATMPKGIIQSITYGRATRARKRVGTLRILGALDTTSATTEANSPIYFTMVNGVVTYEA